MTALPYTPAGPWPLSVDPLPAVPKRPSLFGPAGPPEQTRLSPGPRWRSASLSAWARRTDLACLTTSFAALLRFAFVRTLVRRRRGAKAVAGYIDGEPTPVAAARGRCLRECGVSRSELQDRLR